MTTQQFWIRTKPIRLFETMTPGGVKLRVPSKIGSFLQWRDQLKTSKGYWTKIKPYIPDKNFWEWTKTEVISAFATAMQVPDDGHCPQCNDTGRVTVRMGATTWQTWCLCNMVEWISDQVITSNANSMWYPPSGFSNFDAKRIKDANVTDDHRKILAYALQQSRAFAINPDHALLLIGPTGVGKTHLLWSIATNIGEIGRYITGAQLVQKVIDAMEFGEKSESMRDLIKIWTAPVPVFIDDLNAEYRKKNGAVDAIVLSIINQRMTDPEEYPTVITMNLTEEQLASDILDRMGSRLSDKRNEIISMPVPSYRRSEERKVDYVNSRR